MQPIWWDRGVVKLIDQTQLPQREEILTCTSYLHVARAIETLQVRGAPAIGVAAAMGLALAAREFVHLPAPAFHTELTRAAGILAATRPTAVNLFWALEKMKTVVKELGEVEPPVIASRLEDAAVELAVQDLQINRRLAEHGCQIVGPKTRILTHCNAGALATAGYGTALGIIRHAYQSGRVKHVYAGETRPLLQGARLTAWELVREGIPVTLITDNMAGTVLQRGMVDLVLVGADRIAANGDVANKVGTYSLAVLAQANGISFFVAAPLSTFDFSLASGADIPIEERDAREVTHIMGQPVAPEGVMVFNPAFDVTPSRYISGIVTERGIIYPPYTTSIKRLAREEGG